MRVIRAVNVNDALTQGLELLSAHGVSMDSRNGPVIKADMPVATVTERPEQRVLFHPWRDANPFFHFYESLWMLAGRRDIKPLTRYVARMAEYSDDGITQNAAYGFRWRHARETVLGEVVFNRDQLSVIISELRSNPKSRQCVLQIWDHELDLGTKTKDHACNIAATFQIDHFGRLEMVVFCRSNDAIWGCHGANAVHFSVLMEYVARSVGVQLGSMTQVSVNYHAYADVFKKTFDGYRATWEYYDGRKKFDPKDPYRPQGERRWATSTPTATRSALPRVESYPLMVEPRSRWDRDVEQFISEDGRLPKLPRYEFFDPFFRDVAWPVVRAHDIWKDHRDAGVAIAALEECQASDWRRACVEWLERRKKNK